MSTNVPPTPEGVQRITTAQPSLSEDIASRMRRYSLQMGVRLVCFVVVALLWRHLPVWLSVILMIGATVLPGVAVLFANAGRVRRPPEPFPAGGVLPPAIGRAPDSAEDSAQPDPPGRPASPRDPDHATRDTPDQEDDQ